MSTGRRHWIAVASSDHVALGRTGGFMQVCHGKAGPLRRISPGDDVIYYSPHSGMGTKDRLQAFTALGTVLEGSPYQTDQAPGFSPWRRDVAWETARETPIRPLLGRLAFAEGGKDWGSRLRFGLLAISDGDAELIATAMGCER